MKNLIRAFASMKVTAFLLVLGMALVVGGTLAQRDTSVWIIQEQYFAAWMVLMPMPQTGWLIPIFPGGFTIGALLMLNLICNMIVRRKSLLGNPGYLLTHGGMILLIVSVLAAAVWSQESYIQMSQGETKRYSQDYRDVELAIIHEVDAQTDQVTVVAQDSLLKPRTVTSSNLPFTVRVRNSFPNTLLALTAASARSQTYSNRLPVEVRSVPDAIKKQLQTCLTVDIELLVEGEPIGRWLVSSGPLWDGQDLRVATIESFTHEGERWTLSVRQRRYYLESAVTLKEFRHERYAGTQISRAFSSAFILTEPSGSSRDVMVSMNKPFRYDGRTYYQSGFQGEDTTVLQVVANPGWLLPYLACIIITIGLILELGVSLRRYQRRREEGDATPAVGLPLEPLSRPARLLAYGIVVASVLMVANTFRLPGPQKSTGFDLVAFGQMPVYRDGRVMPLDSVARHSLLQLMGKQQIRHEGRRISAIEWLTMMAADHDTADQLKVFVIDHPDLLNLMGRQAAEQRYFSFGELEPYRDDIRRLAGEAVPEGADGPTTPFGRAVMTLQQRLALYQRLRLSMEVPPAHPTEAHGIQAVNFLVQSALYRPVPPGLSPAKEWLTLTEAAIAPPHADSQILVRHYRAAVRAFGEGDAEAFNQTTAEMAAALEPVTPWTTTRLELIFNHMQPFYVSMLLYVGVFLLMLVAWTRWWGFGRRTALALLTVAVVLHTGGLVWRVVLHGYAPVTNLYSSAVFVGWMAVVLSLFLEWKQRSGYGNVAGAIVGFTTLIVAHHLARGGDTMEMMRAVLDSNFWLSTHVVTMTMGYGGMFLAGAIGIVAVFRDILTRRKGLEASCTQLAPTVYGILAFALLFSFVGTVLGGIWADQSWGRFWGWDPKENGALLVCAWCALAMHGRIGRFLSDRGLMYLAIGGNIVTALSWFGVNLLGVGLHSYGFTSGGVFWLTAFSVSQLAVIALGSIFLREPVEVPAEATEEESQRHPASSIA